MNVSGYREFLKERNISTDALEDAIATIEAFAAFVHTSDQRKTLHWATGDDVNAFSEQLISEERNTHASYLALLRYGRFIRNRALYATALEFLDGAEAFDNLHTKIADTLGEVERDMIFGNVSPPPLGTPIEKRPSLIQQVLSRLETDNPEACKRILGSGLRDLPDEWFQDSVTEFESCSSIDEYLAKKSKSFIDELEEHKEQGKWWFVQEITGDVVDLVRQHPLMSGGLREGHVIYQVKIPYMAKEWLEETDPKMKRYYACHCPWVRESLRTGNVAVSPIFCNCSAAFHKKPWEIIFGQSLHAEVVESILAGDDQCMLAIHLPKDIV